MAQQDQKSGLDDQIRRTLSNLVRYEEQQSKFFFIRRMPSLGLSRDWERPPESEYQRQVLQEGFVTSDFVKKSGSDDLAEDIRELEQHLLPHFWRENQQARYYQNRYYQYPASRPLYRNMISPRRLNSPRLLLSAYHPIECN